ncbi:unnamed protein product (macronuclear) [Paramecium tetraurelia]|uniref:Uncharacterized protein n=1 Tax=Paramecium tetraurelia TaxID=5888 RepID=A0DQU4_PARTE|nr:uncharacterized protein GSPATT00002811001 [Paramecium tetraurelia]CAK85411.1 unnamed protein product [Paramecium tetraurelia]|eukprot:XP_001452808.1 hypothetical protein (macronuclear) [Paramecium tetraurelia strain d4-2]
MIHSTHSSIPSNRNELSSFRRVNSPGLPNSSLRTSFKSDNKKLEIGLITDRKPSQSPELNKAISPEKQKISKRNDSIFETSEPQAQPFQMVEFLNKNLKMIEKIESDKLCLNIYISENDKNQIVFTGMSKEKAASEENKKEILQNLQQLFKSGMERQNEYIRLESLEQQFNLENHKYYGINTKNVASSNKRIATQINDNKSIFDRSLSISSIKDLKSYSSNKIQKDIEIIEQGIMKYKMQQKTKSKQQQPFGQHNCTNTLKSKSSVCKSPLLRTAASPSCKSQRKTDSRVTNKAKINTKSMHA